MYLKAEQIYAQVQLQDLSLWTWPKNLFAQCSSPDVPKPSKSCKELWIHIASLWIWPKSKLFFTMFIPPLVPETSYEVQTYLHQAPSHLSGLRDRAVIKFHFGPHMDSLETSSMYFFCKILNSLEFGLNDKLLQSEKFLVTGLNTYARPNISELKNLHRAGI